MLKDVGMDGRYSADKARAIKERRELQADLEAVQEYNKDHGRASGVSRGGGSLDALRDMGFDVDGEEDSSDD